MNQIKVTTNQQKSTFLGTFNEQKAAEQITNGLSIRKQPNDDRLKESLRYVFVLIGLRSEQIPNDFEKEILLNFIRENYSGLVPEEIKTAFEMAIKGEIKIQGSAGINHFGQFTSIYFSSVLNAYQEKRSLILIEIQKQREKDLKIEMKEPSKLEIENIKVYFLQNVVLPIFESFKETGKLDTLLTPPFLIFDSLKKLKIKDFSAEEKKEIAIQARKNVNKFKTELIIRKSKSFQEHKLKDLLLKGIEYPLKDKEMHEEECFKIGIEILFKELIKQNKSI